MTTRKFDRLVMCLTAGAVVATAVASIVSPAKGVTASPRVSFDSSTAEVAYLNQGVAGVNPSIDKAVQASAALADQFEAIGYRLDEVRSEGAPVPRVFLTSLPADLHAVPEVKLKKTLFFKTMLPLILKENERIYADRKRLIDLRTKSALGYKLPARDRLWVHVLAERYKVKDDNLDELIRRVDVIPPSLAMAQAAEESGWGTSRFAQLGNALFGQWTVASDTGIVPKDRADGKTHKIKAFDNLAQSVSAYMRNLNTHRAYRALRKKRAQMRKGAEQLDGFALAGTLLKYSERGEKYVRSIRLIIDANTLRALDDARLVLDTDGDQSA